MTNLPACATPGCDKTAVLYHGRDRYCTFCWIKLLPPPQMCVNCDGSTDVQVLDGETGEKIENVLWVDTDLGAYLVWKIPEDHFFGQLDIELVRKPIHLEWKDEVRHFAKQLLDESSMRDNQTIAITEHRPEGSYRLVIPLERFEREDAISLGMKGLLFTIADSIELIEEEIL